MINQCKKYFLSHFYIIAWLIILGILNTFIGTVSPYITGNIITDISSGQLLSSVIYKCKILVILYLVSQSLNVIIGVLKLKVEMSMGKEFNCDVIFHVQNLPYDYIQKQNISALNQAINQDTNTIIAFCIDFLLNVTMKSFSILWIGFLCFSLNVRMSMIIVISSVLYSVLYHLLKKHLFAARKKLRISESVFFSKLFEQLEYIYFIKTNAIERLFRKRIEEPFAKFASNKVNDTYLQYIISSLQSAISVFSQVLLFVIGAQYVYEEKITIGLLISFSTYFSQVQSGILYFLNLGTSYQNARVSSQRIYQILSRSKESSGQKQLSSLSSVKCENLSFSFSDKETSLYTNLSFSLQNGKIYGLCGENGSGKTTLINALLGLYNNLIPRGKIFFNGIDIHDVDIYWLRKEKISYISQNNVIIPATYNDNVFLLNLSDDLQSESTTDKLEQFLNLKKDSTDSISISTLSGGEARKVCLMRALIKNSDFLILDEPDTSLDQESCLRLVAYLQQIKYEKIILLVSHNSIFIDCCDEKIII